MTHTHTYAILPVSSSTYQEIKKKLLDADYKHVFGDDGDGECMDMHGIALQDDGTSTSDGHHTFDELYEHRCTLFLLVCKLRFYAFGPRNDSWMSKLHSDGTMFEGGGGWFVVGINRIPGDQITYHLPLRLWDEAKNWCRVVERAPEWDGHGPQEALERLKKL